jgi:hypothetical protein
MQCLFLISICKKECHLKKKNDNHEPLNLANEILSSVELYKRLFKDIEAIGWSK